MTQHIITVGTEGSTAARRPITRLEDLDRAGFVSPEAVMALRPVVDRFQLRLTRDMAALIDAGGVSADPIARQFIPSLSELTVEAHELSDPIGDGVHEKIKGITHRYPDRVLLKPTHLCQVYCRFCFRRETVGHGEEQLSEPELHAALDYIEAHSEIFEVILSGGDPLVLSDRRLALILDRLEAMPHVAVVRFHTRAVIADPARVTPDLVRLLKRRFATWVAIHVNHPGELSDSATAALARLVDGGIPLVSQTVLLAGVNDDAATLERLMRGLVARRVKPYYLHHLDFAEGTGHFRTSIAAGEALTTELRGRLSGLAQPTYVLDIPGGHGKVPINPAWVVPELTGHSPAGGDRAEGARRYLVRDWQGGQHTYNDPSIDAPANAGTSAPARPD